MQAISYSIPLLTRFGDKALGAARRHWRFVVIAMLVLLHIAVLRGLSDDWARALLLAHLGLLLIWQPFLRGQAAISGPQIGFITLGAAAIVLWLSTWLLVFWVTVLAGLVGGKVFQHQARWQRRYYLLVLVYLLALLAIVILPDIAPRREISDEVRTAAEYGLPLLFVMMALVPAEPDPPEAPQIIDFLYSIFLMLVVGVVILGSFTFMTLGRTSYLEALTYTVFLIAGALALIGLAWNPRTGIGGLNVFFSRYVFSIGLPVEDWLHFLAELSQLESRPERFFTEAVAGLVRLPWVSGARWRTEHEQGEHGQTTKFPVEFESDELALTIYSRYRTSPALHWHLRLLGQLLGEFYTAKLREQKLQQQSYLQAVHETGARMTHDMKNLLQSLNALVSVAARETGPDYSPELQALIGRQLPVIAQRLAATLDRLQRPQTEADQYVALDAWWEGLKRQYRGQAIEFDADALPPDMKLPRALADSVADNLLQNALAKRQADPAVQIHASLMCDDAVQFRVRDTGRAMSPEVEKRLFRVPVSSRSGLGIGLYQSARHAESKGYALTLASNRDGDVCFVLSAAAKPADPAQLTAA